MPTSAGFDSRIAHGTGLQVHVHVRHARRRVEGRQQTATKVVGLREQARVLRQLMRREQAAEDADRDLEVLDRDVAIEIERSSRNVAGLPGLVVEAHDDHGVERVDRRHVDRRVVVPVARRVADGIEIVVSPRALL